ncbi:MAG: hypothetical protein IAE89_03290 [Anaerolineae bacterium]|nr:hypothetical protein [Anaerolineae bacterium]
MTINHKNRSFQEYYARTIGVDNQGFKLVLGGTGLGKTSGIVDLLSTGEVSRKVVYCANRIQLLDEMAQSLTARFGADFVVVLPNDTEVVYAAIKPPYRTQLYDLLDDKLVEKYVKAGRQQIKEIRRTVEVLARQIDRGIRSADLNSIQTRSVLYFFRGILGEAARKKESQADHIRLLDHPIVQLLFPFVAFKRRDEARVLLVTVQKGFRRFFDGSKGTSLPELKGKEANFIIFLDEFDFLEPDLIDLICSSPQIEAPFDFVEAFYREMTRHKLPKEDYPEQTRIRKITELVETELQDNGIDFPNINQFTSLNERREPAIFQTSRTHINAKLYIKPGIRSFEIVTTAGPDTYNALRVFDTIHDVTRRILYLYKELQAQYPRFYRELLRQCYENTVFQSQIERIVLTGTTDHHEYHTEFDALLNEGYGLYEIERLGQESDEEEVKFRHYSIYTTPERMLLELATNNLVFGLSATADIPRTVRNFHLDWLRQQPNIHVYEVDREDRDIIRDLNARKLRERGNAQLVIRRVTPFDPTIEGHNSVKGFMEALRRSGRYKNNLDADETDAQKYRLARVENFFKTLLWITSSSEIQNDAHLMFYLTFREIEDILRNDTGYLFEATRLQNSPKLFNAYEVLFSGIKFIVVFYNAELAKNVRTNPEHLAFYNELFWRGHPVIVVTQYSSAGNGVNLQYEPFVAAKKTDFGHIHLMDVPHFFFERWEYGETDTANVVRIKKNIWYAAKLYSEGTITRSRFEGVLSNLRDASLNTRYRKDISTTSDAILNQIATLIQALGRIERVWEPVPSQTVTMSDDVFEVFQKFVLDLEFEEIRNNRNAIISNNLRQLLEQVQTISVQEHRANERRAIRTLINADERSIRAIDNLLSRLQDLRKNGKDIEARQDWAAIRQAVLRLDFDSSVLSAYQCVFPLPYYAEGKLSIAKESLKLYPPGTRASHIQEFDLNSIYGLVRQNELIQEHFTLHQFPLVFPSSSSKCITLSCFQSILAGAIGEEAISAILQFCGITLEPVPDALFETIDLKILSHPWYIDCKNYNERTMDNFRLGADDPAWHFKLNEESFKQHARRKLKAIAQYHSEATDSKLIYINLFGDRDRFTGHFNFDDSGNVQRVKDFETASLIVVQGILQRRSPNSFHPDFEYFMNDFQQKV